MIQMNTLLLDERNKKISTWFGLHGQALKRFVHSLTHNRDEADDISQEVWYQLTLQEDLDAIRNVGAWLFAAAKNRVINFYKKNKTVSLDNDLENSLTGQSGTSQFENSDMLNKIETLIAGFSPEQQMVYDLMVKQGFNADEVSAHTGLDQKHLISVKYQVLKKIRNNNKFLP